MRSKTLLTVAGAGLVAVTLAGCGASGSSHADASGSKSAAASTPSASGHANAGSGSSSAPLVQATVPTKVANEPAARKNVVQTSCAAIPGGWGASGTATNPGKSPVTYKIMVYFTTSKATVLNYAATDVTVAAGKTEKWHAEKKFAAQPTMLCPMPGIATA